MLLRAGLPPEGTQDGLEEAKITKFNMDISKVLPQEESPMKQSLCSPGELVVLWAVS